MSITETRPGTSRRLTTSKAMVAALTEEMERDASVFYLGEDVGAYGGIFGSTTGLLERFGPERVIDTPISETAFIGLGIGAAVEGMRPVVELMFADFMGVCLDQIYNHMAKIHFESGGHVRVPMVLAMAAGGGYSDGAQHSQCLWGTFAHLPGMKVVVPSTPADAKGLMTAAIRDDNPVVYVFHKGVMGLPWMAKNPRSTDEVPDGEHVVPIGRARTRARAGRQRGDPVAVRAPRARRGRHVGGQGIDVEVLDLRSLVPLDREAILESVSRTGRLVVVDEDYLSFGVSAEVVATVTDHDPGLLRPRPGGSPRPTCRSPTRTAWSTPCCRARTGSSARSGTSCGDRGALPPAVDGGAGQPGGAVHVVRPRRRPGGGWTSCSPRCRSTRSPPRCPRRWPAWCTCWSRRRRRCARERRSRGSADGDAVRRGRCRPASAHLIAQG